MESVGLAYHARHRGEALAIVSEGRSLTFAELYRRSNQVAHALRAAGIGLGDTVALAMHNRCEWLEMMQAVGKIGARVVPIGYRAKAPEIAYLLADSCARLLVAENALAPEIDRALHQAGMTGSLPVWVVGEETPWRGTSYEAQLAQLRRFCNESG
jgi:long-chain acyl-CoA synthetase